MVAKVVFKLFFNETNEDTAISPEVSGFKANSGQFPKSGMPF